MAFEPMDVKPLVNALSRMNLAIQREAQARIEAAAQATYVQTVSEYHIGPTRKIKGVVRSGGTLRASVTWGKGFRLVDQRGRTGSVMYGTSGVLGAWVWSRAPHAWLYENKSKTDRGGHGRMPGFPTLKKWAPRERELMYRDIQAIIDREAAKV